MKMPNALGSFVLYWWKRVLGHGNTSWVVGLYSSSYRGVLGRLLSQNCSYSLTFSVKDKWIRFFVPSVIWSPRTHRGTSIVKVFSKCSEQRCIQMLQPWSHGGTLLCRTLLSLLYLLHHFSHFRAVFYCWTKFLNIRMENIQNVW